MLNCGSSTSTGYFEYAFNNYKQDIEIFPNPTNGLIYISYPANTTDVFVTDIVGRKVFVSANRNAKIIDLSFAPSGIYFLHVKTENGVTVKKIVKE